MSAPELVVGLSTTDAMLAARAGARLGLDLIRLDDAGELIAAGAVEDVEALVDELNTIAGARAEAQDVPGTDEAAELALRLLDAIEAAA
jgi:hypothetical protein